MLHHISVARSAVLRFVGDQLTKLKQDVKAKLEDNFQYGGRRNATQVLVNSCGGTIFAVATALQVADVPYLENIKPEALMGGFLGHYACCCADTWASEVGVLSKNLPRLVTTMQPVPKGTNGGVSMLGTLSGVAGSLLMGTTFWLASLLTLAKGATLPISSCVVIALFGGMVGNFADSLLGSTLQYSGYSKHTGCIVTMPRPGVDHVCGRPVLSNSQVNLVSSVVTSMLTSCFACMLC